MLVVNCSPDGAALHPGYELPTTERAMSKTAKRLATAAGLALGLAIVAMPVAAETVKHGGTLTFMIPADAPPSLDGHRETTYATAHAAAPFYSVLIRVNPDD